MKLNGECPVSDAAGVKLRVFGDRICDGRPDCPDASDENGDLGDCVDAQPKTDLGCCGHLYVSGASCPAVGTFGNRDYYMCDENPKHVIFRYGTYDWFASTSGLPSGPYGWYARNTRTDSWEDTTCPFIGEWLDGPMEAEFETCMPQF